MSSFTGLKTINATDINNQGEIRLSSDLDAGSLGKVIISQGEGQPAIWGDNGITYAGGNGITITNTTIETDNDELTISNSSGVNKVLKTPGSITISQNTTIIDTFDGSINKTIDLEGKYLAGCGIDISGHPVPHIEADTDETTITHNAGGTEKLSVIKVPNDLTFTGYTTGTFNGSSALNINLVDTDTTYQGGTNISIGTFTTPNTINLDSNLSNIDTFSFTSTPSTTSLIGNTYPSNPTPLLYCDLSSTTNIIPSSILATKIQRTSLIRTFTNIYSEYSSNFRTSFKALSSNVMVEFRAIVRADNRVFYGGLYDYNAGSYNTDTRNRFNYNDETDQDHSVLTWWMRNLTPGNTYYISPYFRGSSSSVYIYAGHSGTIDGFAPAVMRIIDGGNNVNIY